MLRINLEFIRTRRILLKLTLQDMAEALGFKYAANYMKYERGEYEFKANHIPALAQKLECEIDDLFFEKPFAKPAKDDETCATRETA